MATQCEDDFDNTGFETQYLLRNTTELNLFYLSPSGSLIDFEAQSILNIANDLNPDTEPIPPSQTFIFDEIRLFNQINGDFILVYEQSPLNDDLWSFKEPSMNRFEYELIITDDLIEPTN